MFIRYSMQSLDPSQLQPASVLQGPGSRPGEVVIVDVPGKGPTVYQWSQDEGSWIEVIFFPAFPVR